MSIQRKILRSVRSIPCQTRNLSWLSKIVNIKWKLSWWATSKQLRCEDPLTPSVLRPPSVCVPPPFHEQFSVPLILLPPPQFCSQALLCLFICLFVCLSVCLFSRTNKHYELLGINICTSPNNIRSFFIIISNFAGQSCFKCYLFVYLSVWMSLFFPRKWKLFNIGDTSTKIIRPRIRKYT